MLILNKINKALSITLFQTTKFCTTISIKNKNTIEKSQIISNEQQTMVLNILNNSDQEELSNKISISQARLKSLEKWKTKNGHFRSLEEVLEVDGLSEKVLQKICKNIIEDWNTPVDKKQKKSNGFKIKQLLTPNLPDTAADTLESAVAIHLNSIGISWAKMHRNEKLISDWDFHVFSLTPKKMLLNDNFYLVKEILPKIPKSDVYIFESTSNLNPQGPTQISSIMSYIQNLGITAMLLALLNTSTLHNNSSDDNKVYYLRSRVPARLFGTLVGGEKVAAITRISELLDSESKSFSLPCTRVDIEKSLKNSFESQNPANKELLGQSLMLAVAFMDLCVYKNLVSYQALLPGKKNGSKKKDI